MKFSHRLREHIATVRVAEVFAAKGKWVAGWPTRDEINLLLDCPVIKLADVTLENWPIHYRFDAPALVFPHGRAGIGVSLNQREVIEAGTVHPHG